MSTLSDSSASSGPARAFLLRAYWQDMRSVLRREGPVSSPRRWPADLEQAFGGPRRLVEAWAGDGANFARYETEAHGPLFLKYLPAGERQPRYFRRFLRETTYLRDLAPLVKVPHAPLLHAAQDEAQRRAHLLTRDLTETTWGWGHFQQTPEQAAALRDIARLLAQFHAAWETHPALTGDWAWRPRAALSGAEALAQTYQGAHEQSVRRAAAELPALFRGTSFWGLVHGDIHSGQVLWPRDGAPPTLIDYGQIHTGLPGEDLAHLLAVRLNHEERKLYGPGVREAYWAELSLRGITLGPRERAVQERAGVALNLLTLVQQRQHDAGEGLQEALENVVRVWEEG